MKPIFRLVLSSLLLASALALSGRTAWAQSATTPPPDTSKKPHFTVKTLGMSPVYAYQMNDNANVDMAHQFGAARPLAAPFHYDGERHLANIEQLTFEGVNTHPTISPDDRFIAFQARGTKAGSCDQIFLTTLTGGTPKRISSGAGKTADPAFLADGEILYSSTQGMYGGACPARTVPDTLWKLESAYDLYVSNEEGKVVRQITFDTSYYDAESSVAPNGNRVVFTTTRRGGMDLYAMNPDGTAPTRLTFDDGYNGGARYSPDNTKIVFCAAHPNGEELSEFTDLAHEGLLDPKHLEIWTMDSDGANKRAVTNLGAESLAPCWSPDGEHIVFSSNYLDPSRQHFDLFMIKRDGTGLERLTYGGGFNGFPIFTPDGKRLVFVSARNATHPSDRNVFIADWEP